MVGVIVDENILSYLQAHGDMTEGKSILNWRLV